MDTPNKLGDPLIKSQDDAHLDCGTPPLQRPLEEHIRKGIVLIDKPSGPNSHQISAWVRDMLGVSKAGHSGTLDPKVTGLLPVTLESSTKIVSALLNSGKEYVGVMRVHKEIGKKEIQDVFQELTGPIYQKPPQKSAVKRNLRIRNIYEFELTEKDNQDVLFRVSCEAGTYIRKLIHDAGLILGCGAHMSQLRRTRVGAFTEEDAVILQDLKDAYVAYKEEGREEELRK
ncbi:MAG: RNA-guided pseudouridylation complex pseudouridine synthase subunit Cbf5, partial [Candidatus Altiarchaeota archaeon]